MRMEAFKRQKKEEGREAPEFWLRDAFLVFFLGAVIGIGLNLVFSALGITRASEAFQQTAREQFSRPFWEGIVLYGLAAPVLEELIFRKGVYGLFRRFAGSAVAMVISSALFGVYHGNMVQGLYGFLMGMALAVSYERYKKLLAPILFHGGANMAVYLLMYMRR